ncbi:MAG: hypothetical protein KC422_25265 [Trueperaceae bacterium]|nr:hypothetical protein [Trueperaceae bacterium]
MKLKRDPLITLGLVLVIEMTTLIIIDSRLLRAVRDVEPSLNALGDIAKRF